MFKTNKTSSTNKNRKPLRWQPLLVFGIAGIVLLYFIAANTFIFRFLTLVSFAVLITISILLYKKIENVMNLISEKKDDQAAEEKTVHVAKSEESNSSELKVAETDEEAKQKEMELTKLEWDKTQIFNELFRKANLQEEEKKHYLRRITEKEKEVFSLKQELSGFRNKIQQAVIDKTNFFLGRDMELEDIIDTLDPDFILDASFEEINEKLKLVKNELSDHQIQFLKQSGHINDRFEVTRMGYREWLKIAKKKGAKKVHQ